MKINLIASSWWLTPVTLAAQEAEIRRSWFKARQGKSFSRPYPKKTLHKNRAGGVAQSEVPEFKPQYCQKEKKKTETDMANLGLWQGKGKKDIDWQC
jgi:hypothetical protein